VPNIGLRRVPTRFDQCPIIALEVQYLSRQFWRAAPVSTSMAATAYHGVGGQILQGAPPGPFGPTLGGRTPSIVKARIGMGSRHCSISSTSSQRHLQRAMGVRRLYGRPQS